MRMLRDEKNYVKEREIKPVKLECNFQNQQSWENGFLVKETMKELISRFPIRKQTKSKNDSCQQWDVRPPQQFQGPRSISRVYLFQRKTFKVWLNFSEFNLTPLVLYFFQVWTLISLPTTKRWPKVSGTYAAHSGKMDYLALCRQFSPDHQGVRVSN